MIPRIQIPARVPDARCVETLANVLAALRAHERLNRESRAHVALIAGIIGATMAQVERRADLLEIERAGGGRA